MTSGPHGPVVNREVRAKVAVMTPATDILLLV